MSSATSRCSTKIYLKVCRDKTPSALYFKYNTQLGPPYQVLVDTNFINFSIRNKVSLLIHACEKPVRNSFPVSAPVQLYARLSFIYVQIDLEKGMMDCLYAECKPCITECVMAELEKLGQKYRVALKIAKDPRIKKLPCTHKGTYADDCICERVTQHRCYIVATCDKDLRRRLRKVCDSTCSCQRHGNFSCMAYCMCRSLACR